MHLRRAYAPPHPRRQSSSLTWPHSQCPRNRNPRTKSRSSRAASVRSPHHLGRHLQTLLTSVFPLAPWRCTRAGELEDLLKQMQVALQASQTIGKGFNINDIAAPPVCPLLWGFLDQTQAGTHDVYGRRSTTNPPRPPRTRLRLTRIASRTARRHSMARLPPARVPACVSPSTCLPTTLLPI